MYRVWGNVRHWGVTATGVCFLHTLRFAPPPILTFIVPKSDPHFLSAETPGVNNSKYFAVNLRFICCDIFVTWQNRVERSILAPLYQCVKDSNIN